MKFFHLHNFKIGINFYSYYFKCLVFILGLTKYWSLLLKIISHVWPKANRYYLKYNKSSHHFLLWKFKNCYALLLKNRVPMSKIFWIHLNVCCFDYEKFWSRIFHSVVKKIMENPFFEQVPLSFINLAFIFVRVMPKFRIIFSGKNTLSCQ